MAGDLSGHYTISITGDSNDSNLVLGSTSGTITETVSNGVVTESPPGVELFSKLDEIKSLLLQSNPPTIEVVDNSSSALVAEALSKIPEFYDFRQGTTSVGTETVIKDTVFNSFIFGTFGNVNTYLGTSAESLSSAILAYNDELILTNPFQAGRSSAASKKGVVCAENADSASAGVKMMNLGGNAVDAIVATVATEWVVADTMNGPGGDGYCFICLPKGARGNDTSGIKVVGVGKGGWTPGQKPGVDDTWYKTKTSPFSWQATVTPGSSLANLLHIHERYGSGNLTRAQVLEPAIDLATNGFYYNPNGYQFYVYSALYTHFPAPARSDVSEPATQYRASQKRVDYDPSNVHAIRLKGIDELHTNLPMAQTLQMIADHGLDAYFSENLPDSIINLLPDVSNSPYSKSDMSLWLEDISTNGLEADVYHVDFFGRRYFEHGPPTQGIALLIAINIFRQYVELKFDGKLSDFRARYKPDDAEFYLLMFQMMDVALSVMSLITGDPDKYPTGSADLHNKVTYYISEAYANEIAKKLRTDKFTKLEVSDVSYGAYENEQASTAYMCAADGSGVMVSYINSIYWYGGSGIQIPGTGVTLANRAAFMDDTDVSNVNYWRPNCRPFMTNIPAMSVFVDSDGNITAPDKAFGHMGGGMQAQGQFQEIIDQDVFNLTMQDSISRPHWLFGGGVPGGPPIVNVCQGWKASVVKQLELMEVPIEFKTAQHFGEAQSIKYTTNNGVPRLVGAAGPINKDSAAVPVV